MTYAVYSPAAGKNVMEHLATITEAAQWIGNYPDRAEAKQMKVVPETEPSRVFQEDADFPRLARL